LAATVQQLRALSAQLFALFGQNEFLSAVEQRAYLDRYADLELEVRALADIWQELQNIRHQLETAENQKEITAIKQEILLREIEELKSVVPAEEWQRISQEHQRALHATTLLESSLEARDILADSLMPKLTQVRQKLSKIVPFDAKIAELLSLLEEARPPLEEVYDYLLHYCENLDFDPGQLQQLDALVLLHESLAKKYKVLPEHLYHLREQKKAELAALTQEVNLEEWRKKKQIFGGNTRLML